MKTILASGMLMLSVGFLLAGGNTFKKADLPKYISTLTNKSASPQAKAEAANIIGKRGSINVKDVEEAVEPLKMLVKDKDATVRASAVRALGGIAPEPTTTVPLLIDVLKNDKSQDVKFASVDALARYGPEAKAAVPAIRDFGKGLDKKQQQPIRNAMMAINGTKK